MMRRGLLSIAVMGFVILQNLASPGPAASPGPSGSVNR